MNNSKDVKNITESLDYFLENFYNNSIFLKNIGSYEKYKTYLSSIFEEGRIEFRGDVGGLNKFRYSQSLVDENGKLDVRHKMGSGVYTTPDIELAEYYKEKYRGQVYLVLVNSKDEIRFSSKLDFYKKVSQFNNRSNFLPNGYEIDEFTKHVHSSGRSIHVKKIGAHDESVHPVQNTWILGSLDDIHGFEKFMKKNQQILSEKNITFDDLDRITNGTKRGDILLNKISQGEEIKIKPSSQDVEKIIKISHIINKNTDDITPKEIVSNKYTPYDHLRMKDVFLRRPNYKTYTKSLRSQSGEEYQLNDIVKTSDFGSSGGSSLGTISTIKVESIYCFYFSIRQFLSRDISSTDDLSYFLDSSSIKHYMKTPITITQEIIDEFSSWQNTFIETANGINKTEKYLIKNKKNITILSPNKKYSFHQINSKDELITSIVQKYRSFGLDIPISKWTPSDIWAVEHTRKDNIILLINSCRSFDDLNRIVNNLFDRSELVGISLKKISPYENNFKIIINNESPKPKYSFSKVILLDEPLGTINTTIVVKRESEVYGDGEEKIDLRTFSSSIKNIDGEVIGKDARFGKISLKKINSLLKESNIKQVETISELLQFTEEQIKEKILQAHSDILEKSKYESLINISKLRIDVKPLTLRRLLSKYQGIVLVGILLEKYLEDPKLVDKILQDIFYYALSIQNEEYECPKYVRII